MRLVNSGQTDWSHKSQLRSGVGSGRVRSSQFQAHECCTLHGAAYRLAHCGLPCMLQVGLARGRWVLPSAPRTLCGGGAGGQGSPQMHTLTTLTMPQCDNAHRLSNCLGLYLPRWCTRQLLATCFHLLPFPCLRPPSPPSSTTRDSLRFRLFRRLQGSLICLPTSASILQPWKTLGTET
jgi:hypothetical protein